MNDQVWTFGRGGQQLQIRRTPTEEGILLAIHGDGPPRMTLFTEPDRLRSFQQDFEKFLLATGWSFLGFSPERRTGRERRHFSRLLTDRRRWWTDGVARPHERDRQREITHGNSGDRRRRRRLQPR